MSRVRKTGKGFLALVPSSQAADLGWLEEARAPARKRKTPPPTALELARQLERGLLAIELGDVKPYEVIAVLLAELWAFDDTDAIQCRHMQEAARLVRLGCE